MELRMTINWRMSEPRMWKRPFAQISSWRRKSLKTNGAIKGAAIRISSVSCSLGKGHYSRDRLEQAGGK